MKNMHTKSTGRMNKTNIDKALEIRQRIDDKFSQICARFNIDAVILNLAAKERAKQTGLSVEDSLDQIERDLLKNETLEG